MYKLIMFPVIKYMFVNIYPHTERITQM